MASLLAAVIVVVATLLSTASAAGTYAVLSDTAEQELLTVTSGSIKAASVFGAAPTVSYTATVTEKTGNVTVSNSGTLGATYTTTLTRTGSDPLAKAVAVALWKSTAVAGCTTPVSPVTGTWASFPVLTGTLAAGASQFYCIRTTLASATGIPANASVTATLTTSLAHATWTSSAASSVTQTFVSAADTIKPTAPVLTSAQSGATDVRLNWTAATDNVGVVEYLVYRGSAVIGTVNAGTLAFTDPGRAPGATYSYSVQARDKAGNATTSNVSTVTLAPRLTCATDIWEVKYTWTNVPNGDPNTLRYNLYLNGKVTQGNSSNPHYRAMQISPEDVHALANNGIVLVEVKQVRTDGKEVLIGTGTIRATFSEWGAKTATCI